MRFSLLSSPLALLIYFVIFFGVYFIIRKKSVAEKSFLFRFVNVSSFCFCAYLFSWVSALIIGRYVVVVVFLFSFLEVFLFLFLSICSIAGVFVLFSVVVRHLFFKEVLSRELAMQYICMPLVGGVVFLIVGDKFSVVFSDSYLLLSLSWIVFLIYSMLMGYKVLTRADGMRSVVNVGGGRCCDGKGSGMSCFSGLVALLLLITGGWLGCRGVGWSIWLGGSCWGFVLGYICFFRRG